ncbi:hypothetical protein PR202_ga22066 [Eleusine coracana subsp. coracana]|uniref:F-box domain-containing protein n=1 Tax=Eleusine coracana subsp. coracana TaxID=191504 RepID=A0AAV5D2J0_ELECO|nr:hypothetical protein PR202_ga22066 [Eleusine coracana subsp. coracana]
MVLEDEDLLGEILVRVALPTSLVRAALVCRHWLCVASDPGFLLRFHCLHPPRVLGFYMSSPQASTSPSSCRRLVISRRSSPTACAAPPWR